MPLRDLVVFARHNLGKDPPFSRLDVVSCRNVLIYFSDETIAALLDIAWWNWSAERISRNLERIVGADIDALRGAA